MAHACMQEHIKCFYRGSCRLVISHGTTNETHEKTELSQEKTAISHEETKVSHEKPLISLGWPMVIHGDAVSSKRLRMVIQ